MKKHTLIAALLLLSTTAIGQLHVDLQGLATSRGRLYGQASIAYRVNVWEFSANAAIERKNNTQVGALVSARFVEHNTDASEAITIGIGGQYVWQLPSTRQEAKSRFAFSAAATYMSDWSRISLHYTGGAIAVTFGYRLFNHNN